jgi:hypothetical protein
MAVDDSGIGSRGGFHNNPSGPGAPGAPRLRVVGFAMMGGVEVRRRPADQARPGVPGGPARPQLPGA